VSGEYGEIKRWMLFRLLSWSGEIHGNARAVSIVAAAGLVATVGAGTNAPYSAV